jgi:predicted N-acetyltransferase YhbS
VPIRLDEATLGRMVETSDIDLGASCAALDEGEPVGFALLALREAEAWVGGMGVAPEARRRGHGRRVMEAILERAARRGAGDVFLEVIAENLPAIRLYEQLGFEHVRDLEVWTLGPGEAPAAAADDVRAERALSTIRLVRRDRPPWQRADGTLAHLEGLEGLVVERGAAVFRAAGADVSLLQLAADDDDRAAIRELLAAAWARGQTLRLLNEPAGSTVGEVLRELGGRVDVRQHEMALRVR